jgi:hypothetical protein
MMAVSDRHDDDPPLLVLDTAHDSIGADLVAPKPFELPFQRLAHAPRILRDASRKKLVEPIAYDCFESEHLSLCDGIELNPEA